MKATLELTFAGTTQELIEYLKQIQPSWLLEIRGQIQPAEPTPEPGGVAFVSPGSGTAPEPEPTGGLWRSWHKLAAVNTLRALESAAGDPIKLDLREVKLFCEAHFGP